MSRFIPVFALIVCAVAVGTVPAAPVPPPKPLDEGERLLARGKKFAEQGRIDLFVAVTAAWKLKADDPKMWEPAVDLGRKLIEKAEMKGDRKPQNTPSSDKDFATFVACFKPAFKRMDEVYFRTDPRMAVPPVINNTEAVQAPGVIDPQGISDCLILSQGNVQARGIQSSVVFANGDVSARTIMQSVVMVCDGDVILTEGHLGRSVVVARGNISAQSAGTIVLMAGGKVEFGNKDELLKRKTASVVVENKPNTLGITFFELSTVGIEVKVVDKLVQVSALAAGKPCAQAGLKVGDTLLTVNSKKFDSAESLRRALRDALAVGDATVTFRRGDKTETATVVLPD